MMGGCWIVIKLMSITKANLSELASSLHTNSVLSVTLNT